VSIPTQPSSPPRGSAHKVYRRIRDLIIAGRLSPGARLVEADLAGRLGVSRGAVRPALLRLRQEGFAAAPRQGKQARLVVAALTREDAVDLFSIMGELEGLAGAQACGSDPETHGRLMADLRRAAAELAQAAEGGESTPQQFLARDRDFHQAILVAGAGSDRPRLMALHASLRPQLDRYSLLYAGQIQGHLPAVVREHRTILAALKRRDVEGTRTAVRTNWQRGADRLVEAIDRIGARGDWSPASTPGF